MRQDAFVAFAARTLANDSVRSYVASLIGVERKLGVDLDESDLNTQQINNFKYRLERQGVNQKTVANYGSALKCYARFQGAGLGGDALLRQRCVNPDWLSATPRPPLVRQGEVIDLLRLYGDVLDELRDRGVLRTGNGPVGDYAERLFATAFDWELEDNSKAGYDAKAADVRYQIKARRLVKPNASRQLGVFRNLASRPFDTLAAVLFDRRFDVQRAALIPYEIVAEQAKWTRHVNGHRLLLPEAMWAMPGVQDVTPALRAAANR